MNKFALFLRYPPTIAAALILAACNAAYFLYFAPGLLFSAGAAGLDLALLIAWGAIGLRSKGFAASVSRMPYETGTRELSSLLNDCTPDFKATTLQCTALVDRIRKDFPNNDFEDELGLFVSRLRELAGENARLFSRSKSYGTRDQQTRLAGLVKDQEAAIRTQLESLRSFSGNLSLIEAGTADAASSADLKYINAGMEELLKESQRGN